MPKLIDNTVVVHPKTGSPVLLAATGELPDWAVGLVGDHLLDGTPAKPARSAREDDEVARLKARIAELEQAQAAADAPGSESKVPPRQGPGSGADKWRAYAKSVGVEVGEDASRDDVIVALEAASKPTK